MNEVVAFEKKNLRRPSVRLQIAHREEVVKCMAEHLVSAVLHGLNTSSDIDVIAYLLDTPERFNHRVVLDNMDSAMLQAKSLLMKMEICTGA
jgi:hypothetical protein